MFTKNIKDTFTKGLLDAVSGVLGEAKKKCSEGCECEACENERNEMEEAKEGYIPTQRNLTARDNETIGKLAALMKKEREAKEKKEPNGVKTEEAEVEEGYVSHAQRKAVWANRADDGKGHPDKKKKMKEEAEELDEKRGLWDNIHAKRKRIKAGSGERMRKPGSEGAPTAADFKASQKEEVEIDEATTAEKNKQYIEITHLLGHKRRVPVHPTMAYKALNRYRNDPSTKSARIVQGEVTEEAEQVDEVAPPGAKYERMVKHIKKAYAKDGKLTDKEKGIAYATAWKAKNEAIDPGLEDELMSQRQGESGKKWRVERMGKTISTHNSKDMADVKAMRHPLNKVKANEETEIEEAVGDITIKKISPDEAFKKHTGQLTSKTSVPKDPKTGKTLYQKVANEEVEQIDELSKEALGSYVVNAAKDMAQHGITAGLKIGGQEDSKKNFKKMANREKGINTAVSRLTQEEQEFIDSLNAMDLDEARGRPKKNAGKDFTVNPRTKEKLYHDNPEHMARIEKLQKNGVIAKPKTEASQHIINQLSKAKTSMRGGETIHFTHGESQHVSGTHAARLLDKYHGMKPDEKEAFQKKIGHSHAKLKSEL